MSEPVSPTYTSYSVPSPFSSGSSASYPNRSPVSDAFDTISDSDNHRHPNSMEDYSLAYPQPSSSLPVYTELGYIAHHDFDYNVVNWSASDMAMPKRQQAQSIPQQYHQHPSYRSAPSQDLPSEVERLKNLALYIPPSSPSHFHHTHPTVIHSPIPITVTSNIPSHHSPHPTSQSLQNSHRVHHHSQEQYFDVDGDEWRGSPTAHAQYPPSYAHSQPHSVAMNQGYSSIHGDPSQAPTLRRTVSDYSQHLSGNALRIKQEDMDMYASLGQYSGRPHAHSSPRHAHIFDLSAEPKSAVLTPSPHMQQPPPLSPNYYARAAPELHQHHQQPHPQHHQQHSFAIHPAELSPSVPQTSFDAHAPPVEVGYAADVRYEQGRYSAESGYAEVCDPQFVSGCVVPDKGELADPGRESDIDDGWDARRRCLEAEYAAAVAAGEQREQVVVPDQGADVDADADADADGEDDIDAGYASSGYAPPPQLLRQDHDAGHQRVESPDLHQEQRRREALSHNDDDEDDGEDDEPESEDDDSRDPEFVLRRPRRHTSASYPEGRYLRSTRYNPYPSYSSASPTGRYSDDFPQNQYPSQPLRPRRSYSHNSVSPSVSESNAPLSAGGMNRRRSRPTSTLPIPVPVPNLTKKSRGRRVPTMEDFQDDEVQPPVKAAGVKKKGSAGLAAKGMRTYTCDVDGCGKLFARGEHLKRHVRSIHTYEKPHRCPYPGCGKDFSRHDNLGQHMRVHKDYVPPKDGHNGYKV
ncbi:hypothetical protein H0H81_011270 [Sphagnurus paluster]|uniref:C2H2-type domain-containing protein n=1 Tax=Sphagnurus paluster TaxID=117069 RepID=A0A9P7FSG1_9AGAR|nr:hypothetical protein H0H81_011270 [Sphagnurus paluster]